MSGTTWLLNKTGGETSEEQQVLTSAAFKNESWRSRREPCSLLRDLPNVPWLS